MRILLCFMFIFSLFSSAAFAGIWEEKCSDCHGLIAPAKEVLLAKFKTPDELAVRAQQLAEKGFMPKLNFGKAAEEIFSQATSSLSSFNMGKIKENLYFSPLPSVPLIPENNTLSPVKIILGKMLFFETRLSRSNTLSCNNCHNISSGGDDNSKVSLGYGWRRTTRNAPTVFNVGYLNVLGWTGKVESLEEMVKGEILDSTKLNGVEEDIISKLKSIPEYVALFRKAFPEDADAVNFDNVSKAIASYLRTLNTFGSKFDRFLAGDEKALSDDAKLGMELFKEKGCIKCHSGALFTDEKFYKFDIDGDPGRFEITGNKNDLNMFRTAPLRNVALTAPYFHNGSVSRLDLAVKIMADKMLGEKLTDVEAWRIKTFLESLTAFPSIDSRVVPVLPQKDD